MWDVNKLKWLHQPAYILGFAMSREIEILLLLAVYLLSRYRRAPTMDHFAASLLLFSKAYVAAMLWNIDRKLFGWFGVFVFTLFITLRTPEFSGMSKVITLGEEEFRALVMNRRASQKPTFWLVEFTASWHTEASLFQPMLAELSLRFTGANLGFARVDIGNFPNLAKEMKIDTGVMTKALPSFILFKGGKEKKRLPPLNKKAEAVKMRIHKEGLIQYFELDRKSMD